MSLPKNFDPGKSNLAQRSKPSPDNRDDVQSGSSSEYADCTSTTRCAVITGGGRSAIAVISLRGANAGEILRECFQSATKGRFLPSQIRYGVWTGPHQESSSGESVVVTPLRDDHFEIHCHGGPAATTRILGDLCACGADQIQGESLTSADNLLLREAYQVLAQCLTARTAAIAIDQARGAMSAWVECQIKAVTGRGSAGDDLRHQVDEILRYEELGTRLAEPFRVVLVGPPNVGKSSLLNAIVGYDRSITFDAAGTTRDVLHAATVIDGLPVRLSDTAGIRATDEPLERQGVARAQTAADDADLLLAISAPENSQPSGEAGTGEFLTEIVDSTKPCISVLNKSDLLENSDSHDHRRDVATNALSGEGVADLLALISGKLCESMPDPGSPVPITNRQAKLLRVIRASNSRDVTALKLQELLGVNI